MIKLDQSGQMLILVIITLGIVLFTVLFVIAGAQIYFQNASYSVEAEKATALAEAGVDKALASLNKTGGSYNGEQETAFGDGVYSVTVTDKGATTKVLNVTGYIPDKNNPKAKRTISTEVSTGEGIAFNYGLQVGEGGICMGNGSILNGSIYSNGKIIGGNSTLFNGDAWVAGAVGNTPDQESDCFGANCQDYVFGKNVGGQNRQDVAQSFKPSSDGYLNKISIKLKKAGLPSNPTVRIMSDSNGKPNKNGVLATGTLSANLVTSEYGFVDVTFDTNPDLNEGETYWMMIHSSTLDSSNYWIWSLDLAGGYTRGQPKWSSNWQAGSPVWTTINGDLGFRTYSSGQANSITLTNGSRVNGTVHANTINGNMTITGDAYYQNIDASVTVQGTRYPGSADPPPTVFPVSDSNISSWENQALNGGVTSGNVSGCNLTLGPKKIEGNLTIESNCTSLVQGPLWVTGNLTVGNSSKFVLDSSYGSASGVIVVDGITTFGNSSDIRGSGAPGSYLMLLSNYDSRLGGTNECSDGSESGQAAVDTGNSSISGIIYAPKGIVNLANGASFKEITAWSIALGNSGILNYDSGLASIVFSSGPSGAYTLLKGTYQAR